MKVLHVLASPDDGALVGVAVEVNEGTQPGSWVFMRSWRTGRHVSVIVGRPESDTDRVNRALARFVSLRQIL